MHDRLTSEYRQFLAQPRIAVCALALPDGRQHVTPIKAVLVETAAGDRVRGMIGSGSVKARTVERGSVRASFSEHSSTLWVSLEGPARLLRGDDDLEETRARYAERFGRAAGWGDVVIEVAVETVLCGR